MNASKMRRKKKEWQREELTGDKFFSIIPTFKKRTYVVYFDINKKIHKESVK